MLSYKGLNVRRVLWNRDIGLQTHLSLERDGNFLSFACGHLLSRMICELRGDQLFKPDLKPPMEAHYPVSHL